MRLGSPSKFREVRGPLLLRHHIRSIHQSRNLKNTLKISLFPPFYESLQNPIQTPQCGQKPVFKSNTFFETSLEQAKHFIGSLSSVLVAPLNVPLAQATNDRSVMPKDPALPSHLTHGIVAVGSHCVILGLATWLVTPGDIDFCFRY